MASTIRLTTDLQSRAEAYAEEVGISLNALVAVALRDYVDSRAVIATKRTVEAVAALAIVGVAPKLLTRQQRRQAERLKAKLR